LSFPISTRIALAGVLLCGLMALALTSLTSDADAQIRHDRGCDISGHETDLGASYVTSLNVKNTSCGKGEKVVKAFNKCRHHNGGANGKCHSSVKGFNCNEGKRSGVPGVQYNAKVNCKNGGKKVVFNYTQNA
jgi:hypothetical protein